MPVCSSDFAGDGRYAWDVRVGRQKEARRCSREVCSLSCDSEGEQRCVCVRGML